jgi:hypothetical protein
MLGGSEIFLDDSKNNFERGCIDNFVLDFPLEKDCGNPIQKVSKDCGNPIQKVSCFWYGHGWEVRLAQLT